MRSLWRALCSEGEEILIWMKPAPPPLAFLVFPLQLMVMHHRHWLVRGTASSTISLNPSITFFVIYDQGRSAIYICTR
jgi:hypothetical protein